MIVETGKFKSYGWTGRLGTQGRVSVAVQVPRQSAGRIPYSSGKVKVSQLRPSAEVHYIMEDNLLFPKSAEFNVNLIFKSIPSQNV